MRLQIAIFAFGGLGAFLAALGGKFSMFSMWVAFTTAMGAAINAWLDLRQYDSTVSSYSQLILDLNVIRDHWRALSQEERTGDEFFKLVKATENALWSQHQNYVSEIRQAMDDLQGKKEDTLSQVMRMPAPATVDDALLREQAAETKPPTAETAEAEAVEEQAPAPVQSPKPKAKQGRPHAFVIMPFGQKQADDGHWVDFDAVYNLLIEPAVEATGFETIRADEEAISGDILADMFQELLLANVVIADISIDNAYVSYKLGVRHAMRKQGIIHIHSDQSYTPRGLPNVHTIRYHCDNNGRPHPKHMEKDRQAIIKAAHEIQDANQEQIQIPIYRLLNGLTEPEPKLLRTPLATNYWREYDEWKERLSIAERQRRIGDILLLTQEMRNPLIRESAIEEAGLALRNMECYELALRQYRQGLEINPVISG